MANDFRLFRHKVTGKSGFYPAHFEDRPDFEEVDPSEVGCTDCVVSVPEPQDNDVVFIPAELETDNYNEEDEDD